VPEPEAPKTWMRWGMPARRSRSAPAGIDQPAQEHDLAGRWRTDQEQERTVGAEDRGGGGAEAGSITAAVAAAASVPASSTATKA
jgi:hypothetical protein